MKYFLMLITLSFSVWLISCSKNEWEGFVYPDGADLTEHRNIGIFESLEDCRAVARNTLASIGSLTTGDYECGLNCELRSGMGGIKICEETAR